MAYLIPRRGSRRRVFKLCPAACQPVRCDQQRGCASTVSAIHYHVIPGG